MIQYVASNVLAVVVATVGVAKTSRPVRPVRDVTCKVDQDWGSWKTSVYPTLESADLI